MVFSVPFSATRSGNLSFVGRQADDQLINQVLVFGLDHAVVPTDVDFGSLSPISVVPEPSSAAILAIACLSLMRWRRRGAST